MESKRLVFKPYAEEYWAEISKVFQACFDHEYSRELWEWKYPKNPFGQGRILTAWQGEKLVGQYAAYPVLYRDCRGNILETLHIADVMIDPGARGNGIGKRSVLARLTRAFYETMCTDNVFNYGCPMIKHMRLGKLVLGYHDVGSVMEWEYRPTPVAQDLMLNKMGRFFRKLSRGVNGVRVRRVSAVSADWAELFSEVAGQYGLLVERNIDYLNWRFSQPGKQYIFYEVRRGRRLALWAVLEQRGDDLVIGDMLFDLESPFAFPALITSLTNEYLGFAKIHFWSGEHPGPLASILNKTGFVHKQSEVPVHLAATVFKHETHILKQLNEQRYYVMGDFDLF